MHAKCYMHLPSWIDYMIMHVSPTSISSLPYPLFSPLRLCPIFAPIPAYLNDAVIPFKSCDDRPARLFALVQPAESLRLSMASTQKMTRLITASRMVMSRMRSIIGAEMSSVLNLAQGIVKDSILVFEVVSGLVRWRRRLDSSYLVLPFVV